MKPIKDSCYSAEMLQLAQEQFLLELGIYDDSTPAVTKEQLRLLKAFDSYIRLNVKKMYGTMFHPETGRIVQSLPDSFFDDFTFHVSDSEKVNAFIFKENFLPDGKNHIVVTKGMLQAVENEDELMGVIGHEIGHRIQHLLSAPIRNNKGEEMGSDILSMTHMRNAGYHPKYFRSFMKRVFGQENNYDLMQKVFDPHPSMSLRLEVIDALLEKNAAQYASIQKDYPLDKDVIDSILSLPSTNQLCANLIKSASFETASPQEKVTKIFDFLQQQTITLYGYPHFGHRYIGGYSYQKGFWGEILSERFDHATPLFLGDIKATSDSQYSWTIINKQYMALLSSLPFYLNDKEKNQALASFVFEKIKDSHQGHIPVFHQEQLGTYQDAFKFQISFLQKSINLFDGKDIRNAWGDYLPSEFKDAREKLNQIVFADEAQGKQLALELSLVADCLQSLCVTVDQPYHFLWNLTQMILPPLEKPQVGKSIPYLDLIQKARTYYQETDKTDSLSHQILRTFGVNDMSAFPYKAGLKEAFIADDLLGVPVSFVFSSDSFSYNRCDLTPEDTEKYAPYFIGYQKIGWDTIEYRYNPKTFIVQEVLMHERYSLDAEIETRIIAPYKSLIYHNMTRALNSRFHYALKHHFDALPTLPSDEKTLAFVTQLLTYPVNKKATVLNKNLPFVPDEIKWDMYVKNTVLLDETVRKELGKESDGVDSYVFDFLHQDMPRDSIMETFLRLGEKAQTDSPLADKLIQTDAFFNVYSWYENQEYEYEKRFAQKYRHSYFNLLSKKPFVQEATKLQNHLSEDDVYYLHQNHPTFLRKIYQYRAPLGGSDLNISYAVEPYYLHSNFEGKAFYENKSYSPREKMIFLYDTRYRLLESLELKSYLYSGKKDVSAALLLRHQDIYNEMREHWGDFKESADLSLLQHYIDNFSSVQNWPSRLACSIPLLRDYLASFRDDKGFSLLPMWSENLMDKYHQRLMSKTKWSEKRDIISLLWNKKSAILIPNDIRERFLGMKKNEPSIWTGDIKEQVKTYNWLTYLKAFANDGQTQQQILSFLLDKIEQLPRQEREQLSFSLLGKRSNIEFPTLQRRAGNMWVQAVSEIVGGVDDMSKSYLKKCAPFIARLKNKKSGLHHSYMNKKTEDYSITINGKNVKANTYTKLPNGTSYDFEARYTELSLELQSRLSSQLQETLVSQERLSDLLEPHPDITESLSNDKKTAGIGGLLEVFVHNCEKNPALSGDFIKFLLKPLTYEATQKFNESLKDVLFDPDPYGMLSQAVKTMRPEFWMPIYEQFWDKPFEVRALVLKGLYGFKYKEASDKHSFIINDMLDTIFPYNMENRKSYYNALKNYAMAVPDNEEYSTYFLLAGCLVAQHKTNETQEFDLAQTIRVFLESQGPAGIKVGQFLSVQDDIPQEMRSELLHLTNHASTPSRAKLFDLIRTYHPHVMEEVRQTGLGKILGAASHYITFELNETEVLSLSKYQSGLEASRVYKRLGKALEQTIKEQPENAPLLKVVQDSVSQTERMNHIELNGNVGYIQMRLSQRLYDNVKMQIDGFDIEFETMKWTRQPDSYRAYVTDGPVSWSQNYKIMQKANGVDYTDIDNKQSDKKTQERLTQNHFPLEQESQKSIKKALAKANFLLNLRTILMGGVFDDDRHQGQLKVEMQGTNKLHVNLFDTGSTSIKVPTTQERYLLGYLFYNTLKGISILNDGQDFQEKQLKALFPNNENFDKLLHLERQEIFTNVFHAGVHEIRHSFGGNTPPYIAKVERALANLKHFSCDIADNEVLPLLISIMNDKGNIHQDILEGMKQKATALEVNLIDTLLPQAHLNKQLFEQSDEKTIISSLDRLLKMPTLEKQEKTVALTALAQMFFTPQNRGVLEYAQSQIEQLPTEKLRRVVSQNLCDVLQAGVQVSHSQKEALSITNHIMTYLIQTGLPKEMLGQIGMNLPIMKRLKLKAAFFGGKLRLGKKEVQEYIEQPIARFIRTLVDKKQKVKAFIAQNQMQIEEQQLHSLKDRALPQLRIRKEGSESNDVLSLAQKAYLNKKKTESKK